MKKFAKPLKEKKALMTPGNIESSPKEAAQPKLKRQRVRGVTKLYRACENILRSDGDRVADALFQRALEGNVSSAKLLIKIIEVEARRMRVRNRQAAERKKEHQKEEKKPQKPASSEPLAANTEAKTQ
jgi:DNA gyrase/topoisomerase IV subunit B